MILYTEKQLLVAYASHVWDIAQTNENNPLITIEVPTVEEFRIIYEEVWTDRYGDMEA
tara:strand:- start:557 stop:730 length:174 start_codon:yes stop_codon:yes gene_type:complete